MLTLDLEFNDAYLKYLDDSIEGLTKTVVSGSADDLPTYKQLVGQIQSLNSARDAFISLYKKYYLT